MGSQDVLELTAELPEFQKGSATFTAAAFVESGFDSCCSKLLLAQPSAI